MADQELIKVFKFFCLLAAVIVLELGGIVSVVCSIVLLKGFQAIHVRPYESCLILGISVLLFTFLIL